MPICHERKIIFVHIPKCSGTSIEVALNLQNPENMYDKHGKNSMNIVTRQHLTLAEIEKHVGDISGYYKFTVIRNPYDRIVSAFHWLSHNVYVPESIKKMGFKECVSKVLSMDPIERRFVFDGHFETQYSYVRGYARKVRVFRFENLKEECFVQLQMQFGRVEFGHHLKSDRKPFQEYFDQKTKELVKNFYIDDFKVFKYDTEF